MTMLAMAELLHEIDEAKLSDAEKISFLWKAVMGYGAGPARVPGLLETAAKAQKQTELFAKLGLGLITVFGSLMTHETIGQLITTALRIAGFH